MNPVGRYWSNMMTLHLPVFNQCDRAIQKFDLIVPLAVQLPKTLRAWQQLCHKPVIVQEIAFAKWLLQNGLVKMYRWLYQSLSK